MASTAHFHPADINSQGFRGQVLGVLEAFQGTLDQFHGVREYHLLDPPEAQLGAHLTPPCGVRWCQQN